MDAVLNVPPKAPPPTVTITLSYKEACALMAICGKVAGEYTDIKKNLCDPLYAHLETALGRSSTFFREPFTQQMYANPGFWDDMPERPFGE